MAEPPNADEEDDGLACRIAGKGFRLSLSRFGDCHDTSSKGIFGMLPSPDSLMLAMTSYHFDPKKCALYAKS